MNVLMVTPFFYPVMGGAEVVITDLSKALNKSGVPTNILTLNIQNNWNTYPRKEFLVTNGLNVIKVPALNLFPERMHVYQTTSMVNVIPRKFRKDLSKYDVIHFHNDIDLSFPFMSHFIKKPKVFHCHLFLSTYNYYLKNPIAKAIFKNSADVFITPSIRFLKMYDNLGIPSDKVVVIPNGLDTKKFCPKPDQRVENMLLFVGRLEPVKGLPVLLTALKYLSKPIQLVIIGGSSYAGAEYIETINALINGIHQKTPHKIYYLGEQKREKIIDWYRKATILVCPSLLDFFPVVNLEALACETPVIASSVGGIPDVVQDGVSGLLLPPNDPLELAKKIDYLLENHKQREEFGRKGRKLIENEYSLQSVIGKIITLYNKLI